jgi:hypothetical protein
MLRTGCRPAKLQHFFGRSATRFHTKSVTGAHQVLDDGAPRRTGMKIAQRLSAGLFSDLRPSVTTRRGGRSNRFPVSLYANTGPRQRAMIIVTMSAAPSVQTMAAPVGRSRA